MRSGANPKCQIGPISRPLTLHHLAGRGILQVKEIGMKKRKKEFDAVQFQRKVRKKSSREYSSNPEAFIRELKDKYGSLRKHRAAAPKR